MSVEVIEIYTPVNLVDGQLTTPVNVVEVIEAGPQGPMGPPGSSIAGTLTIYVAVPANTWTLVHNLGYPPAVTIYDSLGYQIGAHIESNSTTTTVISFYYPVAGRATFS